MMVVCWKNKPLIARPRDACYGTGVSSRSCCSRVLFIRQHRISFRPTLQQPYLAAYLRQRATSCACVLLRSIPSTHRIHIICSLRLLLDASRTITPRYPIPGDIPLLLRTRNAILTLLYHPHITLSQLRHFAPPLGATHHSCLRHRCDAHHGASRGTVPRVCDLDGGGCTLVTGCVSMSSSSAWYVPIAII